VSQFPLRTRALRRVATAAALVGALTLTRLTLEATAEPQTPAPTTAAVGLAVDAAATFDAAWQAIRDTLVDDGQARAEWAKIRDEFRPRAAAARSDGELREVLRDMLARLGRSHFDILPATASVSAARAGEDAVGDLGLEVTPIDGAPVVTRVLASGPAASAGVRPGWVLEQISGEDPRQVVRAISGAGGNERSGFRLWVTTVNLLRGPTGTRVPLAFRDMNGRQVDVTLTRASAEGDPVTLGHLPTLVARLEQRRVQDPQGHSVGYIHFNVWMTPLAAAIDRAVDAARGAVGLVVDLRQNPGGVLTMLMGVSGHFFEVPRTLGTLRTRDSELKLVANPRLVSADGTRVAPFAGRVAIVVDETSYSASEIFAGGMQAAGRARVFGARTPGGALPALMRQLPNGDVLEYAIGDFVTVAGRRIEGHGVVPDELVRPSRAAIAAGHDPALDAAIRWAGGGAH
jgi:carboxyl-terminal processing protease